jgi:hypothetical protein
MVQVLLKVHKPESLGCASIQCDFMIINFDLPMITRVLRWLDDELRIHGEREDLRWMVYRSFELIWIDPEAARKMVTDEVYERYVDHVQDQDYLILDDDVPNFPEELTEEQMLSYEYVQSYVTDYEVYWEFQYDDHVTFETATIGDNTLRSILKMCEKEAGIEEMPEDVSNMMVDGLLTERQIRSVKKDGS